MLNVVTDLMLFSPLFRCFHTAGRFFRLLHRARKSNRSASFLRRTPSAVSPLSEHNTLFPAGNQEKNVGGCEKNERPQTMNTKNTMNTVNTASAHIRGRYKMPHLRLSGKTRRGRERGGTPPRADRRCGSGNRPTSPRGGPSAAATGLGSPDPAAAGRESFPRPSPQ